ncbi:MAG: ABC transporter substrate-binding protein [Chloroflexi bacterium]|nr:ABC transporter substrate-binding protein [Chloroflexota bacterium]
MRGYLLVGSVCAVGLALLVAFVATASGNSPPISNSQWNSRGGGRIDAPGQAPGLGRPATTTVTICTYYLGFNTAKAPFNNVLARKAFVAAMDRQSLPAILDNVVLPAMTFTPPGVFGHVDGFAEGVGVPYNPAQAKQWLAEAGYPDGQGLPQTRAVFAPGLTDFVTTTRSAQFAQYNWSGNLSATVTIVFMEASAFLLALQTDPPQMWYIRWCTAQPDADDAYYFLHDGIDARRVAFGNWQNATYNGILAQALATSDPGIRRQLYKQAEQILVGTDVVMLPMHYSGAFFRRVYLPIAQRNQ